MIWIRFHNPTKQNIEKLINIAYHLGLLLEHVETSSIITSIKHPLSVVDPN